ncbi:MAG: DUF3302 domain-containing protein [Verrucomicrobiota bacterium]
MDFLSYFALGLIILVGLILVYGMIAIHDIPYHIAQKRNHPHQDAIHTAGWVSLFTLHAIWPFLWIWATSYHPQGGYAGRPDSRPSKPGGKAGTPDERIALLEARLDEMEKSGKQQNS